MDGFKDGIMKYQAELLEALKEALRVVFLAIIPIVIVQVETGVFDYRVILVTGALALLRFTDKALHEIGKANGNEDLKGGITRF